MNIASPPFSSIAFRGHARELLVEGRLAGAAREYEDLRSGPGHRWKSPRQRWVRRASTSASSWYMPKPKRRRSPRWSTITFLAASRSAIAPASVPSEGQEMAEPGDAVVGRDQVLDREGGAPLPSELIEEKPLEGLHVIVDRGDGEALRFEEPRHRVEAVQAHGVEGGAHEAKAVVREGDAMEVAALERSESPRTSRC